MELLSAVIDAINNVLRWPLVIGLLGAGLFLTVRLGFIQFRRLGHGFAVATGRYDDPDEPGDVSHFQALTTALSATVGAVVPWGQDIRRRAVAIASGSLRYIS